MFDSIYQKNNKYILKKSFFIGALIQETVNLGKTGKKLENFYEPYGFSQTSNQQTEPRASQRAATLHRLSNKHALIHYLDYPAAGKLILCLVTRVD